MASDIPTYSKPWFFQGTRNWHRLLGGPQCPQTKERGRRSLGVGPPGGLQSDDIGRTSDASKIIFHFLNLSCENMPICQCHELNIEPTECVLQSLINPYLNSLSLRLCLPCSFSFFPSLSISIRLFRQGFLQRCRLQLVILRPTHILL